MVGSIEDGLPIRSLTFKTAKGTVHGPYGSPEREGGRDFKFVSPCERNRRGGGRCKLALLFGGVGLPDERLVTLRFVYKCLA